VIYVENVFLHKVEEREKEKKMEENYKDLMPL